jgi:class 3 adenylate cyclase
MRQLAARREVTILFADLSGLTGSANELDAEDVYSIVGACLSRLAEVVQRYEGTVDKFTGSGIMALFGAPVTHDDDAERAVRCALDMQAALAQLSQAIQAEYGVTIQVRIGINVGTVVAGVVGAPDKSGASPYTVIGDSVNIAARLQQAAQPGQILVSDAVCERIRPLIHYRSVGALALKGVPTPLAAYEVGPAVPGT